jgi:hypothetical protein
MPIFFKSHISNLFSQKQKVTNKTHIMVECKTSIYDEPKPPLVNVMLVPNRAFEPPQE